MSQQNLDSIHLDRMSTEQKLALAKELFTYDETTGLLRSKWSGKPLLSKGPSKDIYVANFGGKRISQHRIVWLMIKGEWPEFFIRHRNGNKLDNRPENLISEEEFRAIQRDQRKEEERVRKYRLLEHPLGDRHEKDSKGNFPVADILADFSFIADHGGGGTLLRRNRSGHRNEFREVGRLQTVGKSRYRVLTYRGETVMAHRISWVLHFGAWPRGRLSFADGNTLNINPDNLLEAEVYRNPRNRNYQHELPPHMEEQAKQLEGNAQEILTKRAEQQLPPPPTPVRDW